MHPDGPIELSGLSSAVVERPAFALSGWGILLAGAVATVLGFTLLGRGISERLDGGGNPGLFFGMGAALVALGVIALRGLIAIGPAECRVIQIAGSYVGTANRPRLWWVNPWSRRSTISTKIRTHETPVLKVNDAEGNPIEIVAMIVWRVRDTARALLAVDDFAACLRGQSEAAVRELASRFAYDSRGSDAPSLRGDAKDIDSQLSADVEKRVGQIGIHVVESRITRLAYAPEIAQAMLRVQLANAVVAARHRIVEGAVGMVELALDRLTADAVVDLDEERKAAMVSNSLVVLCSDRDTQPVVNTGSLYQ